MTDRLIISIGNWATVQADGLFAVAATLLIAMFFGALWLLAYWIPSRKRFR
jgi:hypothetical protein